MRFGASWTGEPPTFQMYSTSDLAHPSVGYRVQSFREVRTEGCLQLAMSSLHVCSSRGKRARYMEQKQVMEILPQGETKVNKYVFEC